MIWKFGVDGLYPGGERAFGLVFGFLMSFGSMHPPFSLAFFPSQIVTLSPVDGGFWAIVYPGVEFAGIGGAVAFGLPFGSFIYDGSMHPSLSFFPSQITTVSPVGFGFCAFESDWQVWPGLSWLAPTHLGSGASLCASLELKALAAVQFTPSI